MGFQVTELYKKYGDKVVVDHLSFKMDQPSVYALLGTNGAGKTTSIRMILNMLAKDGNIDEHDMFNTYNTYRNIFCSYTLNSN